MKGAVRTDKTPCRLEGEIHFSPKYQTPVQIPQTYLFRRVHHAPQPLPETFRGILVLNYNVMLVRPPTRPRFCPEMPSPWDRTNGGPMPAPAIAARQDRSSKVIHYNYTSVPK
jgi:hypothetical protein